MLTASPTRVFFVHLPKCGGTTVIDVLQVWFGSDQVRRLPPTTRLHFEPLPREIRGAAVHGHVPYPVIRFLRGSPIVFSVLRDPVARTLSAYHYLRGKTDHPLHRAFTTEVSDVAGFLRSPTFAYHAGDLQTRMLGASDEWAAQVLARGHSGEPPWRSLMGEPLGDCLERALSRITGPGFVLGVQADLPEALNRLADGLGMPRRDRLPRLNARGGGSGTEAAPPVSAADLRRIRRANAHDLVLFEAALAATQRG